METLRALVRGDLSPAGNKISLKRQLQSFDYGIDGYSSTWVDSGTSALALALLDIKAKVPHIIFPKVIVPGYCCPDLVAAAVYAGVKPVVVDICVDDASYDLDALKSAINDEDIIAVIAINFLGIKERLTEIKHLLLNKPIKLIEDNAQWFPASKNEHSFLGDYLVFSFGRGKPLSLLGGGVLFAREPLIVDGAVSDHSNPRTLVQTIKIRLYNILLRPRFYCYLNRAPFLHLGETHYYQHYEILSIGDVQKEIFSFNLKQYEGRINDAGHSYDRIFLAHDVQLLSALQTERRMGLLRYPLLCKTAAQRDKLLVEFERQGLGGSPLYQQALIDIPQILALVEVHGRLKNSSQFAARLLTLPTHEQVTAKHFLRLQNVLARAI
jgi:dTDP-4-amino-4,6-dideoxygalactose transaminase